MSVVFLCHSAVPSGAELSLLRSIRQRPAGTDVTVILGEAGALADRLTEAGASVLVLPMTEGGAVVRRGAGMLRQVGAVVGLLGYARRVRRELKRLDPSVVVGRSLRAAIYGRVATWGLPCRFVWSIHDRLTRSYVGIAAPVYARVLPKLVDGVIVNSRSTLATVSVRKGRPVLVMPPALDLDDRELEPPGSPLRSAVILGRLSPWKGQDIAIRAFAASRLSSTATLDVVGAALFGEDEYARSLRELVRELGLGERVRFTGQVDDPRAILLDADVLVHASVLPEPFGAVVVEGMYAGCLVVATTPGGPAESIDDARTGVLVPCGDVDGLTAAMDRLVDLPRAARADMAEAAVQAARGYDSSILSAELFAWLDGMRATGPVHAVTVSSSLGSA
jgi:glycosyltransferase involved in cell wall biosynthesis